VDLVSLKELIRLADEEDRNLPMTTDISTVENTMKELGLDSKVWIVLEKISNLHQSDQILETSLHFSKADDPLLHKSAVTLTIPRSMKRIKCMRIESDKDIDLC
jgi:hypothetical protein